MNIMEQKDDDDDNIFNLNSPNKKYPKYNEIGPVTTILKLIK